MSNLADAVQAALSRVYDPCSVAMAAPLGIVDMGLVTRVSVEPDGRVEVELRPTSPMCTLIASIMRAVEAELTAIEGVSTVNLTVDSASFWTESSLTPTGRSILEARRVRSRAEVPVRPQEWKLRQLA